MGVGCEGVFTGTSVLHAPRAIRAYPFSGSGTSTATGRLSGLAGPAPRPALICPPRRLQRPGCASLRSDRRISGLSVTLVTDAIRPLVMAKYFASLLLKGAEAFRHGSADEAKQHNIILVNVTAKVASVGENVLGG